MRRQSLFIVNTFAIIAFAGIPAAFGYSDGNSSDADSAAKPLVEQSWSFPKTTTLHLVKIPGKSEDLDRADRGDKDKEDRAAMILCEAGKPCEILGDHAGYTRANLGSIAGGMNSELSETTSSRYTKTAVGAVAAATWWIPVLGWVTGPAAAIYSVYQGLNGLSEANQAALAKEMPSAINLAFSSGHGEIDGLKPATWKDALSKSTGQMSSAQVATQSLNDTLAKAGTEDNVSLDSGSNSGGSSGANSGGDTGRGSGRGSHYNTNRAI